MKYELCPLCKHKSLYFRSSFNTWRCSYCFKEFSPDKTQLRGDMIDEYGNEYRLKVERNKELLEKMDEWRDSYTCDKNCWEWKKWKFCQHLRKARAKIFEKEIEMQMDGFVNLMLKINRIQNLHEEKMP